MVAERGSRMTRRPVVGLAGSLSREPARHSGFRDYSARWLRLAPCLAAAEALGRSRGGFGTKVHAITDALGNPLDFVLTGGQASDIGKADRWLELTPEGTEAFVGDKGYDSDALVQAIEARGMEPVIPPRSHRTTPREVNWWVYKERHLIECFFNKIKHYRRIFSRFEKLARNYMGFLRFVSALIWLR